MSGTASWCSIVNVEIALYVEVLLMWMVPGWHWRHVVSCVVAWFRPLVESALVTLGSLDDDDDDCVVYSSHRALMKAEDPEDKQKCCLFFVRYLGIGNPNCRELLVFPNLSLISGFLEAFVIF